MKHQRYVLLAFAIAAVLMGLVARSATTSALAWSAQPDVRVLSDLISASLVVGLATGVITFFVLLRNGQAVKFADEVVGELAKVTWPTREETVRATTTVIFTTLFIAALMGFYDLVWKNVADLVLFTEG